MLFQAPWCTAPGYLYLSRVFGHGRRDGCVVSYEMDVSYEVSPRTRDLAQDLWSENVLAERICLELHTSR